MGTADFIVHHIHAFTIHITFLILSKGILYARNSRLVSDKLELGFTYPCDGPGRGGTCQFSGRAYWQELIESILWSHHKLKIIPHIQPTALSISQGRAVGLIHYTLGGIGCTWAFIISRILVLTS